MSDATTSNKKLTKPTVGGDANNWGDILNSTFDLIDQTFAGTLAKTIAGDATLTSDESNHAAYIFSGTLSADATITWPQVFGLTIVKNATTGGFALVCGVA